MQVPNVSCSAFVRAAAAPALAFAAVVAVVGAAPRPATAQDAAAGEKAPAPAQPSVRERVEKLVDELASDDAGVRERAEREILKLGEPARDELDRLTRDPDAKRALTALRMLQSEAWTRAAVPDDRREPKTPSVEIPLPDLHRFRDDVRRQMDDFLRRMRDWDQAFDTDAWKDWMPKLEPGATAPGVESSGNVVTDGRSLSWRIDAQGRVRVATKDAPHAAETVVEAPDMDTLRREHPDLAKRLDDVMPGGARPFFRFRLRGPGSTSDRDGSAARDLGAETPRGRPLRDGESALQRDESEAPRGGLSFPADGVTGAREIGPVLGISASSVPDVLRDQLGLESGGVVVESVRPGTLAERLGLRRNDVLLRVAGRDVASASDIRRALESAPAGIPTEAEILRRGRRETVRETVRESGAPK